MFVSPVRVPWLGNLTLGVGVLSKEASRVPTPMPKATRMFRPVGRWFATVLLAGALTALRAQQPPALHSTVNLVNVSFTARDAHGNLLDTLTADQVAIFEDGVEQKVAHFSKSKDLALTLGLIVDASNSQ